MRGDRTTLTSREMYLLYKETVGVDFKVKFNKATKRKFKDLFKDNGELKTVTEFRKGYGQFYSEDYRFKLYELWRIAAVQAAQQGKREAVEKGINKLVEVANERSEKYNDWLADLGKRDREKNATVDADGLPKLEKLNLSYMTKSQMETAILNRTLALSNRLTKGAYDIFQGDEIERRKQFSGIKPETLASVGSYANQTYSNYIYVAKNEHRFALLNILYQLTPEQAIAAFDGSPSVIYTQFYASESSFYHNKPHHKVAQEAHIIQALLHNLDTMGIHPILPEGFRDMIDSMDFSEKELS